MHITEAKKGDYLIAKEMIYDNESRLQFIQNKIYVILSSNFDGGFMYFNIDGETGLATQWLLIKKYDESCRFRFTSKQEMRLKKLESIL